MMLDVVLPAGTRLLTLSEAPDLVEPMARHNGSVWPEFMLQDATVNRLWHHLEEEFAAWQLILVDAAGAIMATANSAPIAWDGTPDGLPGGWDDQMERSVAGLTDGTTATTLGALQIVVAREHQGEGLSGVLLGALLAMARRHAFRGVIACVRPSHKDRYPLLPMDVYAAWRRPDSLPMDPWLRVHVRAGGEIIRVAPESMTMSGTLEDWRRWTGLQFPVSGLYVLPGAVQPVEVDVAANRAVYHDANVWVIHRLAAESPGVS